MRCYHQIMHAYCISSVIRARRASSNGARCQISIYDRARIKIISDSGKKHSISSYLQEQNFFRWNTQFEWKIKLFLDTLSKSFSVISIPLQKTFPSSQYLQHVMLSKCFEFCIPTSARKQPICKMPDDLLADFIKWTKN